MRDGRTAQRKQTQLRLMALVCAAGLLGAGCGTDPGKDGLDAPPDLTGKSDNVSDNAVAKGALALGAAIVAPFDGARHHLYQLSLPQGGQVEIDLRGESDPDFDTVLRVYGPQDAAGNYSSHPIAENDDVDSDRSSKLAGLKLSAGTYAVVASAYGEVPPAGTTYRLEAQCKGGGCGGNTPTDGCNSGSTVNWTIMIYGAMDTNPELPSLLFDLGKRVSTSAKYQPSKVRFVMLEDLGNGAKNSKIYELSADGVKVVKDLGEVNSGKASTLADFIRDAASCFPARHYALSVIGHSVSALDGGLVDYYPEGRQYMRWTDFRAAIEQARVPLDVLNVGVCMSSNVEMAYEFQGLAKYMVGYQSFSQGYTAVSWADALFADPDASAEKLARRMASSQASHGRNYEPQSVSVIDLGKLTPIAAAINELAPKVIAALSTQKAALQAARDASQTAATEDDYWALIDIIDWVDQTAAVAKDSALQTGLAGLRQAVEDAVPAHYVEVDSFGGENPFTRTHGLSMAFPTAKAPLGRFTGMSLYTTLGNLAFYRDTQLDEMVRAYYSH